MKLIQFNKLSSHFEKIVEKSIIISVNIVRASHEIKTSVKAEIYIKAFNITSVINKMLLLC